MMKIPASAVLAFVVSALAARPGAAQEWTRFRGPNGTGVSEAKGVPTTWTEKDFRFRVALPGESHSQPVIWGDKIFLESASPDGKERMLLALSKEDGKQLWKKSIPLAPNPKHKLNTFASSTPVVDKDRVYACFADAEKYLVLAFDHAGKPAWQANLGPFKSQHGLGASPLIFEDRLIVANEQDGASFITALGLKDGKELWRCERRGGDQSTAYGTPCLLPRAGGGADLLTTSSAHGIAAIDARTGAALWEAKVFDKRAVSSPVVSGGLVFGSCGSGGGGNFIAAVKLGGKGDVTSTNLAYTMRTSAPYVPTPVAFGERLYTFADDGVASCFEAASGRPIWKERVGGAFYGSPVLIDGKLYCATTKGEMVVLAAADEYKLISKNPLGEGTHSSACVDGERLYIKTFTHLVCVGGK